MSGMFFLGHSVVHIIVCSVTDRTTAELVLRPRRRSATNKVETGWFNFCQLTVTTIMYVWARDSHGHSCSVV